MDKPETEVTAIVIFPGEKEVGIFEAHWEINGGLIFGSQEDREAFRQQIDNAFELVTGGGHYVIFSDEWPKDPLDDNLNKQNE